MSGRLLSVAVAVSVLVLGFLIVQAKADVQAVQARAVTEWSLPCNTTACLAVQQLFGFVNIGFFGSVQAGYDIHSANADLIASTISTVGLPSVFLSYLHSAAAWQFDVNWNLFNSNVSVAAEAYGAGLVFPRLLEFNDTNGDGQYQPFVDKIISKYEFTTTGLVPFYRRWQQMTVTTENVSADVQVFIFNATTFDGVFSIQFKISSGDYVAPDGSILTPNSTKVDIQISGFPYKGTGTFLALESLLIGANAAASVSTNTQVNIGSQGWIDWVANAFAISSISGKATASSITVSASALATASISDLPFSLIQLLLQAQATASTTLQRTFFTFQAVQPNYVYWDPAIHYGQPPSTSGGNDPTGIIVGVVVGVVVVGVLAAAGVLFYRRKQRLARADPLLPQTDAATGNTLRYTA